VAIPLTLAVDDYDHVRDLVNGLVRVEGVELTCLSLPIEEIFFRFIRLPWAHVHAERAGGGFGRDFWSYGIEANRTTLTAFLGMAHEQGVCERILRPEDLFAPEVGESPPGVRMGRMEGA
jgi:hypothetical protein